MAASKMVLITDYNEKTGEIISRKIDFSSIHSPGTITHYDGKSISLLQTWRRIGDWLADELTYTYSIREDKGHVNIYF